MTGYVSLVRKELQSVAKEKTILCAILVQFFIASFSSVILTGIMAFYDAGSLAESARFTVRVGYVGDMDNPLVGYLRSNKVVVRPFAEVTAAEAAFRARQVDAVMLVPESQSGVVDIQLTLPKLETMKMVMLIMVDEPLKRYENYLREANGIPVRYQDAGGKPYSTYEVLYAIIIPILMFFPALVGGSIVIDTIAEEFENKTIEMLLSAPVSASKIFAAKISAALITAVIQMGVWIGLLRVNGMAIHSPALLFVAAVIFAATISFGAAVIALFFKDRERAQFVYAMALIITGAGTYFINPSPFNLLTRLSAGVSGVGVLEVVLYTIPLVAISLVFLKTSDWLAGYNRRGS